MEMQKTQRAAGVIDAVDDLNIISRKLAGLAALLFIEDGSEIHLLDRQASGVGEILNDLSMGINSVAEKLYGVDDKE